MKDMLQIGLDISLQGQYGSLGSSCHRLMMEKYSLINRRRPDDDPYVFYTE